MHVVQLEQQRQRIRTGEVHKKTSRLGGMSPAAAVAAVGRELQEELWEEIFLRLPPDDPASFLRASLVCKTWRRIVSRPGFLRRLGELHRAPPILGFFRNGWNEDGFGFVPTTASAFSLPIPIPIPERRSWGVVDCRHGRVLLRSRRSAREFLVWEPMTGYQRRLPDWFEKSFFKGSFNAAVMCAAVGCGHWNCHGGPFRVVAVYPVAVNNNEHPMLFTSACVYSSVTGAWGEPTSPVGILYSTVDTFTASTLVGNFLYFQCDNEVDIFKYDIREDTLVALAIGEDVSDLRGSRLTQAEDGELRFVNDGIYTIDPNSAGQGRKVCPFESFYIPPGGQHDARE